MYNGFVLCVCEENFVWYLFIFDYYLFFILIVLFNLNIKYLLRILFLLGIM